MGISDFLAAFYPDENQSVLVRLFKPKGAPAGYANAKIIQTTRKELKDNKLRQSELVKLNERAGVYFVVNAGGNTDDEISAFSAFFIENDELPIEEQHMRLDEAPIKPSIRVITRKSVHAYWLLRNPITRVVPSLLLEKRKQLSGQCREADWLRTENGKSWATSWQDWLESDAGAEWQSLEEQWRSIQRLLIAYFDGDKSIHNPSRLMRLPFFNHLSYDELTGKVEKKKVEVHTFDLDHRVTAEEMIKAFQSRSEQRSEISDSVKSHRTFEYHEDRHAELLRLIKVSAKENKNGHFEMRCPFHRGRGETSLVYFPSSDAVSCNAKCSYFDILMGFGLQADTLPYRKTLDMTENHLEFELHEKAYYGPAGDFARLVGPRSEADEAALLVQLLCAFGNAAGRNAYFTVEADRHYLNLFVLLVGGTSTGRKGTSWSYVKQILGSVDDEWERNCIASGLSSGEGLMYRVRDPIVQRKKSKEEPSGYKEVEVDFGVEDKRLLVTEGEFVQVLRVQGRESNTLSAMLRNFWDYGTHSNLVKNSPLRTTNAHISIIGHITPEEFRSSLKQNEMVNGYLNRFLMIRSQRSRLMPFGGNISEVDFGPIVRRLTEAKEFAEMVSEMTLGVETKELWEKIYVPLETSRSGILAKVTQRASPYVLRLSCIYALLDLNNVVNIVHLEAALAVWQYAENTARSLFGGKTENKNAQKLLDALRQKEGGMTKTDIRDLFQRNISAEEIDMISLQLQSVNLIYRTNIRTDGAKRPTTILHAVSDKQSNPNDINDIYDFYLDTESGPDINIVNVVNIVAGEMESEDEMLVRLEREAIQNEHLAEVS